MQEEEIIEDTTSLTSDETNLQTNDDPIREELERVKPKRTEAEKAIFAYKKQQESLRRLGIDPAVLVDSPRHQEDEDDAPLTIGMFKKMQAQSASKTAKELAQNITNNAERELVEYYLENRIVPSGNAEDDLRLAQAAVNSVRNSQIATMASQRPTAPSYSNASSMPSKPGNAPITDLTETERTLKAQGLVTDDDIRKAREDAQNTANRF